MTINFAPNDALKGAVDNIQTVASAICMSYYVKSQKNSNSSVDLSSGNDTKSLNDTISIFLNTSKGISEPLIYIPLANIHPLINQDYSDLTHSGTSVEEFISMLKPFFPSAIELRCHSINRFSPPKVAFSLSQLNNAMLSEIEVALQSSPLLPKGKVVRDIRF